MRETQDFMCFQEIIAWEAVDSKDLSGVKHVRLDMTARAKGKGAPDKGHTTSFSPSKVVHYFPNFRSYFGMEYEQPWNMGKILLDTFIYICMYQVRWSSKNDHDIATVNLRYLTPIKKNWVLVWLAHFTSFYH